MNDCADNNLPECKTPAETPLLLLFNRILIRYSGDPTNMECKTANMQKLLNGGREESTAPQNILRTWRN